MDWCWLGHACWLADTGAQRLLFDPVLERTHHAGIFELHPERRVHVDALRADAIVISHRHPDHFDPRSLATLAAADPTTAVLTPDPLVERVARQLGFQHVACVQAGRCLDLDGAKLVTTPSQVPFPEWGALLVTDEGTCWNQVDTDAGGPDLVRALLAAAAKETGCARLAAGPDLALVRWQPLLEVNAQLGRTTGFPFEFYQRELARVQALGSCAMVPSAAGFHYGPQTSWMDAFAFPVSPERFLWDVAHLSAGARVLQGVVGAHYRVRGGGVDVDLHCDTTLVTVEDRPDPRLFRPLSIPPVTDPNPAGYSDADVLSAVEPWLRDVLCPALAALFPRWKTGKPLSLAVEVVLPERAVGYTCRVGSDGARLQPGVDPEWDQLVQLAGSDFFDVLAGTAHWGRPLLSGRLRALDRAYRVDEKGLHRLQLPTVFLYAGLSYDQTTERWIAHEVAKILAERSR